MKQFAILLALVGTIGLTTGCSTKYIVHVNGYLDGKDAQQVTSGACICVIESKNEENPLFVTEVRRKIESLLRLKGYGICPDVSADYRLVFQCGMDSGKTVDRDQLMQEPGHYVRVRSHEGGDSDSYSTVYIPGSSYWVTHSETVFTSWLSLSLYVAPKAQEELDAPRPLWVGEITSSGLSSDLREMIDPMLIGAFEHFGQNTRKQVRKIIPKSDPRLPILIGE